jgi:hypothetical protein
VKVENNHGRFAHGLDANLWANFFIAKVQTQHVTEELLQCQMQACVQLQQEIVFHLHHHLGCLAIVVVIVASTNLPF